MFDNLLLLPPHPLLLLGGGPQELSTQDAARVYFVILITVDAALSLLMLVLIAFIERLLHLRHCAQHW